MLNQCKLPDRRGTPKRKESNRRSLVRFIPVLVFFMACEAVQYIGSISPGIVDYSCLSGYILYMAGNSMFHMFAWSSGMNLLQVQKENIFHILVQILQLFFRIIRKDKFHNSSDVSL